MSRRTYETTTSDAVVTARGCPDGSCGTPGAAHDGDPPIIDDPLRLAGLEALTSLSSGTPDVVIGLLDGPVPPHPDLVPTDLRILGEGPASGCGSAAAADFGSLHGTFVAGVLKARRGSTAPALCPGCALVVRPLFGNGGCDGLPPTATPDDLAHALVECMEAGARLVNLSSVLLGASDAGRRVVRAALDEAARRGALVVAAAGNQGLVGGSEITAHPSVIPVVACDGRGRPIPSSNLGPSIGRSGVRAPGHGIRSLGRPGEPQTASGTSVATPFVTGAIALLWTIFPSAGPAELREALLYARPPRTVVPALLDGRQALQFLSSLAAERSARTVRPPQLSTSSLAGSVIPATAPEAFVPAQGMADADPGAVGNGEPAPQPPAQAAPFVYAIGHIQPQFRDASTEREFIQAMSRAAVSGQTDRQAMHSVLTDRENRYLARQLCYVFTIEGVETYLLVPEVPEDYDLLLDAVRREPNTADVDVVVGVMGPLAPPEMCGGRQLPIVQFAQLYSFRREELVAAMPRPDGTKKEEFEGTANELFDRIVQITDNTGAMDEHRAVNYLSVRYQRLYEQTARAFAANQSLTAIEARPSRLAGVERIVDVILTYTDRQTNVSEKYFTRLNMSGMFPFLLTEMRPFYER